MKRIITIAIILFISMTLFGCEAQSTEKEKKNYSNEEITIYVSEFEEQFFYRAYGNLILDHFPGLEIRVITETNHTNGDMKVTEIKKQSPDLIISHAYVYKELVADSYLMNLDTFIKEAGFDLDKYAESMISALRDDNGLLYGLSPDAYISGVFYNKDLFNEISLDHPTNGMDWFELLQLASHFTNGVVGFESTLYPNDLLMQIAYTNEWYFIDTENHEVAFQRSEWEKAIQTIVNLYDSNSTARGTGDLFFNGKSALYAGPISYGTKLFDTSEFAWGFITRPVNTTNRHAGRSIILNRVLSIPNESTQKELSWDIMKMLMSEEAAEYYANNQITMTLSTLKTQMYDYNGINLEAFWDQSIHPVASGIINNELSQEFINEFYKILDNCLKRAIAREISVEECLELIEKSTNEAYEKERLRNASE